MEEKKKSIGLWKNTSKDGKSYISGKDEERGEKITIFQNSYKKEGTREPDYKMYRSPISPVEATSEHRAKVVQHNFYAMKAPSESLDEDAPF